MNAAEKTTDPKAVPRAFAKILGLSSLAMRLSAAILYGCRNSVRRHRLAWFGVAGSIAGIWGVAFAFLHLSPVKYTSEWTFILPTSSSSLSLQVENIGHAQSVPSSPFGSAANSPKVIYKEIANSEIVRTAAAAAQGQSITLFGKPKITLVDETSLINFSINGRSPDEARANANALIAAFNSQLDQLRRDEVNKRADVVQGSLTGYQSNLLSSRDRILGFQRQSGVLSITQFNDAAQTVELLRRKMIDVKAELGRLVTEQIALERRLGVDANLAALALKFIADPASVKVAEEFAQANAAYQTALSRSGSQNPTVIMARLRLTTIAAAIKRIAAMPNLQDIEKVANMLLVSNGTGQANILSEIVSNDAQLRGREQEARIIDIELRSAESALKKLSTDSAVLEDLRRDHLVAEAVFTSALARMDTNKVDVYASYPMVQTLAVPTLPTEPSSPSRLIAFGAAAVATFFALAAWGLIWCRHVFTQRRVKSLPSTGR